MYKPIEGRNRSVTIAENLANDFTVFMFHRNQACVLAEGAHFQLVLLTCNELYIYIYIYNFLEPSGPVQACNGTVLPFLP